MSHIAFFNIPALGHIYPTLSVVRELVRRGHRVTYPAIAERAEMVRATGATAIVYESSRPTDTDPRFRAPDSIGGSLLNFLTEAEVTFPQWETVLTLDPPDLVVFDRMAFAGSVLARKHGIPAMQLWPMLVSGPQWTWAITDPDDPSYLTYQTRLDKFLANQGVSMDLLNPDVLRHIAFLPRAFQPRAELFGDVEFVGPCLRDRRSFRKRDDILLITLGSLNNLHLDFYRLCFEAFEGTNWRVVMPVGRRFDPRVLGAPPANFEVSPSVAQLDVLARARAFVSHAGLGGVLEAAGAGVPQVAIARTSEQAANAKRITELGVGVSLDHATLTASALRAAVSALEDPLFGAAVAALRLEIIASGGTIRAADVIEECLSG